MTATTSQRRGRVVLGDTAFVVPVRIDSPDRLRNLDLVLTWLGRNFEGHQTLVLEHGRAAEAESTAREHGAEHVFLRSDGCFHKSRVFNLGLALADRAFVLLYDCDVLVPAPAIERAIETLRRDEADYVYPYNGVMLEVRCGDDAPRAVLDGAFLASTIVSHGEVAEALPDDTTCLNGSESEPSTGGALACKRRALLLHGGFNPNIVSYGCEDTELETRVRKLGARVVRLPGFNCFHVRHRRGPDSRYNHLHAANLAEWKKVEAMSAEEVSEYVRNGFRSLKLDPSSRLEVEDARDRYSLRVIPSSTQPEAGVAFVVLLASEPALPGALVATLIDEIEALLRGYEIRLVERDGYRHRVVSHRDYVVYESIRDETDYDVLTRLGNELDSPRLFVGSVFMDVRAEGFSAALDSIGVGATKACELPSSRALESAGTRGQRVIELLRSRMDGAARSYGFDRAALVYWLAHDGKSLATEPWHEILDAAHIALRGPIA
jgi:hypothetical protein